MQFLPTIPHFISLRIKYSPQHPFLKHHQSIFLASFQRQSFAPIQNHMQNYSSVYSNFYILASRQGDERFWTEW
jgi:hypothetical protein